MMKKLILLLTLLLPLVVGAQIRTWQLSSKDTLGNNVPIGTLIEADGNGSFIFSSGIVDSLQLDGTYLKIWTQHKALPDSIDLAPLISDSGVIDSMTYHVDNYLRIYQNGNTVPDSVLINISALETDPVYTNDSTEIKSHLANDLDTDSTNELQDTTEIPGLQQFVEDHSSQLPTGTTGQILANVDGVWVAGDPCDYLCVDSILAILKSYLDTAGVGSQYSISDANIIISRSCGDSIPVGAYELAPQNIDYIVITDAFSTGKFNYNGSDVATGDTIRLTNGFFDYILYYIPDAGTPDSYIDTASFTNSGNSNTNYFYMNVDSTFNWDLISYSATANTLALSAGEPNYRHFGIMTKNPVNSKERIIYWRGDFHVDWEGGDIAMLKSEDDFATETVIIDTTNYAEKTGMINVAGGYTSTGRLIVATQAADYNSGDRSTWNNEIIIMKYSDDDGATWDYITLPFDPGHYSIVQDIKYWGNTIYFATAQMNYVTYDNYLFLMSSTDDGLTWNIDTIDYTNTGSSLYEFFEPDALFLNDSTVLVMTRTNNGVNKGQYISYDAGTTWIDQGLTNITQGTYSEPANIYLTTVDGVDHIYLTRTNRGTTTRSLELWRMCAENAMAGNTHWDFVNTLYTGGYILSGYQSPIWYAYDSAKVVYFSENVTQTGTDVILLDVSASISAPSDPSVLFDYTPVGTTIDNTKFDYFDGNTGQVNVTQVTDSLIFTDVGTLGSGVSTHKLTTSGLYSFNSTTDSLYVYMKIDKNNDSYFQVFFDDESSTDYISFRTFDADNNYITLRINKSGVLTDSTTTETLTGEFKLALESGTITISKWNGSSYEYVVSGSYNDSGFAFELTRAVATVDSEEMYVNRVVIRSEDWIGVEP